MDQASDYEPLNQKTLFLLIPCDAGSAKHVMQDRIYPAVQDCGYFDNYKILRSNDFALGSDRQECFARFHNRCTVAVYPVCSEFLREFKSSFSVSGNKVIFVLCEPDTAVPPQWANLEMVDFLSDSSTAAAPGDSPLNRLLRGIRAIASRDDAPHPAAASSSPVRTPAAQGVQFVALDGSRANRHSRHCVRKELLTPTYDVSSMQGTLMLLTIM